MVVRGRVVKGLGIGKKLGYPTANLDIDWSKLSFVRRCCTKLSFRRMRGVYAARAGEYHAVAIVQARPNLVEVYFLDFSGDLYGQELEVKFLEKISEIERFESAEELKHKIEADIRKVRLCLQE